MPTLVRDSAEILNEMEKFWGKIGEGNVSNIRYTFDVELENTRIGMYWVSLKTMKESLYIFEWNTLSFSTLLLAFFLFYSMSGDCPQGEWMMIAPNCIFFFIP